MIAILNTSEQVKSETVQQRFLQMLPHIESVARFAFRRARCGRRQDFVAEVVASAYVAFHRLATRGKLDRAFGSVLAWYAVRQIWDGRRVGSKLNVKDVLSEYAQRRNGFKLRSLHCQPSRGRWEELVLEDKRTTPAEIAVCKLDFRDWLRRLDRRRRAVALRLASGESTSDAAQKFGVSRARISQVRSELLESWQTFQGEHSLAAA